MEIEVRSTHRWVIISPGIRGSATQGFRSLSTVAVSAAASAAVVVQEGTKDLHAKVRKYKTYLPYRLGIVSLPVSSCLLIKHKFGTRLSVPFRPYFGYF